MIQMMDAVHDKHETMQKRAPQTGAANRLFNGLASL
jgi:hypothetical protein